PGASSTRRARFLPGCRDLVRTPLLRALADDAEAARGDRARRTDRGGAEPFPDLVDRRRGSGRWGRRSRCVEQPELLRSLPEVGTGHAEQPHAGADVERPEQRLQGGDELGTGVDATLERDG